ncbi:MAG: hypothetical protein AAFV53_31015 [Myxococcota bacterium]
MDTLISMTPAVAAFRDTLIQAGLVRPDIMLTETNLAEEEARLQRLTALVVIARRSDPTLSLDDELSLEQIFDALDQRFSLREVGIHRFADLLGFLDRTRAVDEARAAAVAAIPDIVLDLPAEFADLQPAPTRVHTLPPFDLSAIGSDAALEKDVQAAYERWIKRTVSAVQKRMPWLAGAPAELSTEPFVVGPPPPTPEELRAEGVTWSEE